MAQRRFRDPSRSAGDFCPGSKRDREKQALRVGVSGMGDKKDQLGCFQPQKLLSGPCLLEPAFPLCSMCSTLFPPSFRSCPRLPWRKEKTPASLWEVMLVEACPLQTAVLQANGRCTVGSGELPARTPLPLPFVEPETCSCNTS